MKIWLTVAEGAEYAGVSRDTIYTACERRELNHARVGGRRDPFEGGLDRQLVGTPRAGHIGVARERADHRDVTGAA